MKKAKVIADVDVRTINTLRDMRWRARTDLLWFCNNILGFKDVSKKVHGTLIDNLQKFPKPTPHERENNDIYRSGKWYYKPLKPMTELEGKRRNLILDFRGGLKCHVAGSRVRVQDGTYQNVENLNVGDTIYGIQEDSFFPVPVTVTGKELQAPQKCYRVNFTSGRAIEVSHEHPFLKVDGWKNAEDLQPGDRIASLGEAPEPPDAKFLPYAEILGWLLGDGSFSGQTVTNLNPDFRQEIIAAARKAGGRAHEVFFKERTPAVRIQGLRPIWKSLDMLRLTSGDKYIPDEIFRADNESVRQLLYAYFMCDGSLRDGGISLTSKSHRLAHDVRRLLIRFNIYATVNQVTLKTGPYAGNIYWTVRVSGTPMVERFLAVIPWRKKNRWTTGKVYNPNHNIVPREWRTLYPKYFFARGEKPEWLKKKYMRGDKCQKSLSTYGGRKEYLQDIGMALSDIRLVMLGSDLVYWDKVQSIEEIGERETWAIETDNHTIAVDDIVTHNTTINATAHTLQWIINYPDCAIAIIQSTGDKAQSILKGIKDHFTSNPRFRELFPELCPKRSVLDWGTLDHFTTEGRGRTVIRREPTVMTGSIDKGLAGYHFDMIKFSDIVDPNNAKGPGLEQVRRNYYMMENLLVSPIYWIDMEGTRYHFADLYGYIVENEEKARKEGKPEFWNLYIRGIFELDTGGKPRTYGPEELHYPFKKDENGRRISIWPERYPLDLLEAKESADLWAFATQMLNYPNAGISGETIFPVGATHPKWITRSDFNQNVWISYFTISVDTAETDNERSDYSVISVAAWDQFGRAYICELNRGKWLPDKLVSEIVTMGLKYHVSGKLRSLKIEQTGFVRGIMASLRRKLDLGNLYLPIDLIQRDNKTAKADRILKTLQPWYKAGDLRFLQDIEHQDALLKELREFPNSGHDDILDSIADHFQDKEWFGRESQRKTFQEAKSTAYLKLLGMDDAAEDLAGQYGLPEVYHRSGF